MLPFPDLAEVVPFNSEELCALVGEENAEISNIIKGNILLKVKQKKTCLVPESIYMYVVFLSKKYPCKSFDFFNNMIIDLLPFKISVEVANESSETRIGALENPAKPKWKFYSFGLLIFHGASLLRLDDFDRAKK